MVATDNKQTNRQTTDSYYPIVPGGKSARDKKKGENLAGAIRTWGSAKFVFSNRFYPHAHPLHTSESTYERIKNIR